MRRRAKVDRNHEEIVQALRKVGALVVSLAAVGRGVPDLLVSSSKGLLLLEVKAKGGKLTQDQRAFQDVGWPVVVVRDAESAIAAVKG